MATDKRQELKQLRALQEQSAALVHLFQALNEHFDSLNKNVGGTMFTTRIKPCIQGETYL